MTQQCKSLILTARLSTSPHFLYQRDISTTTLAADLTSEKGQIWKEHWRDIVCMYEISAQVLCVSGVFTA